VEDLVTRGHASLVGHLHRLSFNVRGNRH
jgi:hypothetical protein